MAWPAKIGLSIFTEMQCHSIITSDGVISDDDSLLCAHSAVRDTKRLEEGKFPKPRKDPSRPDVCRTDLMMMLDGIEIVRAKNSRRYTIAHKV
jgi:hypothetical protein